MEGRHKIQLECYSFEMGYNVFITSVGVRTLYVFVKYKMFFPGINMKVWQKKKTKNYNICPKDNTKPNLYNKSL